MGDGIGNSQRYPVIQQEKRTLAASRVGGGEAELRQILF